MRRLAFLIPVLIGCGGNHAGDTSVCNKLPDPSLCPSGSHPLMTVVGGEPCDELVDDPNCGDLAQAVEQCGLDSPTCVTSNGTAVSGEQSCDAQQSAWDKCIDPNQ